MTDIFIDRILNFIFDNICNDEKLIINLLILFTFFIIINHVEGCLFALTILFLILIKTFINSLNRR